MLEVAAMAAGVPGFRAGVGALTFVRADGAGAATGGGSGAVAVAFGEALCATGCDFGSPLSFFPELFAVGFSAAFFVADLSVDFLAAGFSAVFLPAGFSAPFLAAGLAVASAAAGLAGLSVCADAKGANIKAKLAASAVDRKKRAGNKGFTAVLRGRIVQQMSDLGVVDGND